MDITQKIEKIEMVAAGRQFRVGDTPVDLPIDPRLSFFEVESRHFAEYLNVARRKPQPSPTGNKLDTSR